eukprot:scaffold151678_cov20-Attheya_sp.AAC.1
MRNYSSGGRIEECTFIYPSLESSQVVRIRGGLFQGIKKGSGNHRFHSPSDAVVTELFGILQSSPRGVTTHARNMGVDE